jgi:hypothetical protein
MATDLWVPKKDGEFLERMSYYLLLRMDPFPWREFAVSCVGA